MRTVPTRYLFGLGVGAVTMDDVLGMCNDALSDRQRLLIGVVNAAKIVKLRQDELLRNSLLECDVVIADGQAVVWASRVLRRPLPERIAGIDLFERLLAHADRHHQSVYLLGAQPAVLDTLRERIGQRFPGLRIAGSRDGYFTDAEAAEVARGIAASDADMLFLGMTTPKKEIFLGRFGDSLGVPILHGVGGSFDILAGLTKRAPQRWQRYGLEWLYRVIQEPRRMWRRYLTTNTAFIVMTLRELVRPTPPFPSISRERERSHRISGS